MPLQYPAKTMEKVEEARWNAAADLVLIKIAVGSLAIFQSQISTP